MNRKTLIQFAHLSKQIACFILIRRFSREIMTSIVILFVHLVAPFTSLDEVVNYITERLSAKNDSAELFV